jgi:hypothetical protein
MVGPTDPRGPYHSDDDEPEGWSSFVPDFVKKVAVAGMGALFMTEEGIRSLAGQLKLPKEVLHFILSQAERTKDEVGRVVSEELRRFLQSEKLREEFVKLLSGMTVEIKAEVRLVPSAQQDKEKEKDRDKDKKKSSEEAQAPKLVVSEIAARRGRRGKKE